jgi:hypothetical protein
VSSSTAERLVLAHAVTPKDVASSRVAVKTRPESGAEESAMDSAFAKNPTELRSVDPVWDRIREAAHAAAAAEPVLAGTLHATILSQPRFENALSYHLARLVGTTEVPAALIRQTFDEALAADPGIGLAARADIMAVVDRDPACNSHLDPLLWFKGYHALQTYRASHWMWTEGRSTLARRAHLGPDRRWRRYQLGRVALHTTHREKL